MRRWMNGSVMVIKRARGVKMVTRYMVRSGVGNGPGFFVASRFEHVFSRSISIKTEVVNQAKEADEAKEAEIKEANKKSKVQYSKTSHHNETYHKKLIVENSLAHFKSISKQTELIHELVQDTTDQIITHWIPENEQDVPFVIPEHVDSTEKSFLTNVLLTVHIYFDIFTAAKTATQIISDKSLPSQWIYDTTLEFLIYNLIQQGFVKQALALCKLSNKSYRLPSRMWNALIAKCLECQMADSDIKWIWRNLINGNGVTYVSNGTLLSLSMQTKDSMITNEIISYFVRKNELKSYSVAKQLLISHLNNQTSVGDFVTKLQGFHDLNTRNSQFERANLANPVDYNSMFNISKMKLKASDFSQLVSRLGDQWESEFQLPKQHLPSYIQTLLLNIRLLYYANKRKNLDSKSSEFWKSVAESPVKFESIDSILDLVNKSINDFNTRLDDESFKNLFEYSFCETGSIPKVLSMWQRYNSIHKCNISPSLKQRIALKYHQIK